MVRCFRHPNILDFHGAEFLFKHLNQNYVNLKNYCRGGGGGEYFFVGTFVDFWKFFKFTIHPPPLRVKEPKKYLGTFRNFSGRPPLLLLKNSYFLRKWNKKKNSMILFKIFPKDPPPPTLSKKSCSSVYLHWIFSEILWFFGNLVICESVVGARLGHGWGKNPNNLGQG